MELSKICKYTTSRIDSASLNVDNYISTENMMQNKGGVISASKVPSEKAVEFMPGDILLSNIRPYFKKIWLADRSGGCSSDVLCIRALEGTDSVYLYYLLSQDSFFDYVMSGAKGSKMPRGDKNQIMKWEVDLPDIDEQKRIGQMLKSIDDKILLNTRINHNLEEQAQALYKSWCVCFDPYKSGGFIDSELGPIPHGWQVIPLKDIVDYKKKSVNPQKSPDTWFVHYSLPAFDNAKEPEIQKGASIMSNKFLLEGKTVLFSKLNPRIKRIWPIEKTSPNSICSTEFIVYKAKNESLHPFVWCLLNGDYFYDKVLSEVNGATGSHQRFHADDTLDYVIPFNLETAIRLSEKVAPMLQSIIEKEDEIRVLKAKRDALLSKLMSGELKLTC